jgi:DNA processing protein
MTSWRPAKGWAGKWSIAPVLEQPVTDRERGAIVAMSMDGFGAKALNDAFMRGETVAEVARHSMPRSAAALATLRDIGARAVLPCDDEYPTLLKEIVGSPPLLYVRGSRLNELQPCVAIVGARACTTGAAQFAHRLGEAIASAGFTVVSGLARGIDSAAHHGAVEGGTTIGVLGTGIDVCYPSSHSELVGRIVASGALVTEFPPGVGPREWHFPARNRVIAGMSFAIVAVEAGLRSGALITVSFAEDHGREVFACITGPENPAGEGIRALIKDGARLVLDADDLVDDLIELAERQEYVLPGSVRPRRNEHPLELEGHQRVVYDAVTEGTTVEDISDITSLETSTVAVALSELELAGALTCEFGRWRRARS